jgi:hypothetical protein
MGSKQLVWCVVLGALLVVNERPASAQNPRSDRDTEQTVFDAEADSSQMLVRRPTEIPDSALQVLRDTLTGGVFNCLNARGTTPEHAPASWFLASAIHLNGPDEIDLVVLPNVRSIANPANPGGCLLAAHGGPFWVLGPGIASGRYGLLLATYGLRLEVLNSRTNRHRDIQIGAERTALLYKFTVQQYQLTEKKTAP